MKLKICWKFYWSFSFSCDTLDLMIKKYSEFNKVWQRKWKLSIKFWSGDRNIGANKNSVCCWWTLFFKVSDIFQWLILVLTEWTMILLQTCSLIISSMILLIPAAVQSLRCYTDIPATKVSIFQKVFKKLLQNQHKIL